MVAKNDKVEYDILPEGDPEDRDFDPEMHEFKSNILTAKARVTLLKEGMTVPRSEVSGLVLCTRLMNKAVSLYDAGFSTASCLGDSTCIISALDKDATAFNPYLHARLSEVIMLRDSISKKTNIEEVFHVASAENIADICTRKESKLTDLRIGSTSDN